LPEAVGLLLRECDVREAKVCAGPHELGKIAVLSRFAYALFMRLKAGQEKIREGSFVFRVKDEALGIDANARVFARRGGVGAKETSDDPALVMTGVQTAKFLACPLEALARPTIRESEFLRDALPLPVFWENADNV